MLARIQERRFELLFIIIATVVIGKISIRNLLVTGQELGQQVQAREMKIQRLIAEDIMLSAQIGALETEIDRLQRDSEETSLVARTLLGMVSSDEVIYQLNNQRVEE